MDIAQRMYCATEMVTMANKRVRDTTEPPRKQLNLKYKGDNGYNTHFFPRAQLKGVVSMTMMGAMGIRVVLSGHAE